MTRWRVWAFAALPLILATLQACSTPEPKVAVVEPAPPAPQITLGSRLIEQASAYRTYMDSASAITPNFSDGASVEVAVQRGAKYETNQLLQGAMAYGALVALQTPEFVDGIRSQAASPEQARELADRLTTNPYAVLGLTGAQGASLRVTKALNDDGQTLYNAGLAVKQSAYDLQKQSWSKDLIAHRETRLELAKSLSATPIKGNLGQGDLLAHAALRSTPDLTAPSPNSAPTVRSMTLAALAVLGRAGDDNDETVSAIMADPNVASCLRMSKLNLNQCLAVAGPNYEDIFCLGQHIMMDSGRCVIKASGMTEPYEAKFIPTVRPIANTTVAQRAPGKKSGKKRG